jgi:hypothetical protein
MLLLYYPYYYYYTVLAKDQRINHTGKLCCQHSYDTNATVRTIAVLLEFGGQHVMNHCSFMCHQKSPCTFMGHQKSPKSADPKIPKIC